MQRTDNVVGANDEEMKVAFISVFVPVFVSVFVPVFVFVFVFKMTRRAMLTAV